MICVHNFDLPEFYVNILYESKYPTDISDLYLVCFLWPSGVKKEIVALEISYLLEQREAD